MARLVKAARSLRRAIDKGMFVGATRATKIAERKAVGGMKLSCDVFRTTEPPCGPWRTKEADAQRAASCEGRNCVVIRQPGPNVELSRRIAARMWKRGDARM